MVLKTIDRTVKEIKKNVKKEFFLNKKQPGMLLQEKKVRRLKL